LYELQSVLCHEKKDFLDVSILGFIWLRTITSFPLPNSINHISDMTIGLITEWL